MRLFSYREKIPLRVTNTNALSTLAMTEIVEPNQPILVRERERAKEDGVDDREDGGVGADAQREGEDGDGGEAEVLAHQAQGEADVLRQDLQVLARGGSGYVCQCLPPQLQRAHRASLAFFFLPALPEHLLHLAPVLPAEVERECPQ